MQVFLIIILIIAIVWLVFRNRIRVWLHEAMMRRFENILRRFFGMPSVKEEKNMRDRQRRQNRSKSGRDNARNREYYGHHGPQTVRPDSIIPKEYAEDVEFVEFRNYSESADTVLKDSAGRASASFKVEEQVSDVEYVEIKK